MYSLLLFLLFQYSNSYKILVYNNLFGASHVKVFGSTINYLVEAGHEVTALMPVIDPNLRNSTYLKPAKNLHEIYIEPEDLEHETKELIDFFKTLWYIDSSLPKNLHRQAYLIGKLFEAQCRKVMRSLAVIEHLKAQNFDLGITEPFDSCAYVIFEAINIRAHVGMTTMARMDYVNYILGLPSTTSYVPATLSNNNDQMSIMERFKNFFQYQACLSVYADIADTEFEDGQTILNISRSWRDTLPESTFIFTNSVPLLDFPGPKFDKIIPIGGFSLKSGEKLKLDKKWDEILSIRKKNVLISFGSNIRSYLMPKEIKNAFLQVFESMSDTTFIWKYEDENDTIVDHLDNIYTGSWLPQNELLADPRLNLFFTHGGMGSVIELSYMGKPAVIVPVYADQPRNAQMLKRQNVAEIIEKSQMKDAGHIERLLRKVMEDTSYRRNAEKLAEMLNNQPVKPKETFLKHVEFAARFGKIPTMESYGRHLSLFVYYHLDIISIVAIVCAVFTYTFYMSVYYFLRRFVEEGNLH